MGVVYYSVAVYRALQAKPDHMRVIPQTKWRDVPIAEMGTGEEYQISGRHVDLYLLEYVLLYDPPRSWAGLNDEDDDEDSEEELAQMRQRGPSSMSHGGSQGHCDQSERLPGVVSGWDHLFQRHSNRYGWD